MVDFLFAETPRKLVEKLNAEKVTGDDIINIVEDNRGYVAFYYKK